jgi:putative membrane protein
MTMEQKEQPQKEQLRSAAAGELPFTDQLAYERTLLAAERTMLSYIRTAIGLAGGGAGLMLLRHSALFIVGIALLVISVAVVVIGLLGYRRSRLQLESSADRRRQQAD